jgi:hypothetical protein
LQQELVNCLQVCGHVSVSAGFRRVLVGGCASMAHMH